MERKLADLIESNRSSVFIFVYGFCFYRDIRYRLLFETLWEQPKISLSRQNCEKYFRDPLLNFFEIFSSKKSFFQSFRRFRRRKFGGLGRFGTSFFGVGVLSFRPVSSSPQKPLTIIIVTNWIGHFRRMSFWF